LGRGKQNDTLKSFCDAAHFNAKAELATCFIERCNDFCTVNGASCLVTPQNWLFLGTFKEFRRTTLERYCVRSLSKLGGGAEAFNVGPGNITNVALISFEKRPPTKPEVYCGLDVTESRSPGLKSSSLVSGLVRSVLQIDQINNSDARIGLESRTEFSLLQQIAHGVHGLGSKDTPCFFRQFWEMNAQNQDWEFLQTTVSATSEFGGMEQIVYWQSGAGILSERGARGEAILAGGMAWSRRGVLVSQMGVLSATRYMGEFFDKNAAVILPANEQHLPAIWAFCSSSEYNIEVRKIDQKLSVTNVTLVKVPFDLARWEKVAAEKYPNGLPKPFSSNPTQWLFNGHPYKSDNPLQVAVARLLCYQWPRQTGSSFPDCPALGADGLEKHADDDGIVALSPINREEAAAARLRALLKDAYGAEWQDGVTERQLLSDTGHGAATLEEWLRDSFFEEHCKLFHHRPFIWHIWDGEKDGFHVLVNYHRLAAGNGDGTRLLQKLATTYLGDWIARCTQEVAADKPGAARRLKAAQDLQDNLRKILEGEAPNDIFVRWKPLREQAIGWAPDINDGVRLNIRPFLTVRDVGKKGAGLLRFKPNVKWDKDRGKEPQRPKSEFPWFWSCDPESNPQHATDFSGGSTFTGERWNELHYTLAAKRAARASRT
jgi:hypothetical protein